MLDRHGWPIVLADRSGKKARAGFNGSGSMQAGLRRVLVAAAVLGGFATASVASACTLSYNPPLEIHYSGVPAGSPTERHFDRVRVNRYYKKLRREAQAGQTGDPKDFAWNVVNALVPPIMAGPDEGTGCGGRRGDEDQAGNRKLASFKDEFGELLGARVIDQYGHPSQYGLIQFIAIPRQCNIEFRKSVATELATRVDQGDLAKLWGEIYAHDLNYSYLDTWAPWPPMRLLKFASGRSGNLVPNWESLPKRPYGRDEAVWSLRVDHHKAMLGYLTSDPAAQRVIAAVNGIVGGVQTRPGGDERYCPAAMIERQRIVAETRKDMQPD